MRGMSHRQVSKFSGKRFDAQPEHQESREERDARVRFIKARERTNLDQLRDGLSPAYFDDYEDFHETR